MLMRIVTVHVRAKYSQRTWIQAMSPVKFRPLRVNVSATLNDIEHYKNNSVDCRLRSSTLLKLKTNKRILKIARRGSSDSGAPSRRQQTMTERIINKSKKRKSV